MQGSGVPRFARLTALAAALAGCAQLPEPRETGAPMEAPKLGVLDGAYDRAKWKWIRNPDGRALLTHTELQKCFVNPKPDQDFLDPGFSVKRGEKTIGPTRYEVVSVFEKRDLWEVIYVRPGTKAPVLGVFSTGKCQDEAERILHAYEKILQR